MFEPPQAPELEVMIQKIKTGLIPTDDQFDRIFPSWAAERSRLHWTPLPVIRRILHWIESNSPSPARVLDIGSGAGKFCLAAGILSKTAHFFGIEQRSHLCTLAQRLATLYQIPRVDFRQGDALKENWNHYDTLYFYNPFHEHRAHWQCIDKTIALSPERYDAERLRTWERLRNLRPGTRLITYHGYGKEPPPGFERVLSEHCYRGPLEVWIKQAA